MLAETQRQFVEVAEREIFILHPPGPMLTNTAWVAAYLLGRLEGENGATIEEIAGAARKVARRCCSEPGNDLVHTVRPGGSNRGVHRYHGFDLSTLFRAIALEALTGEPKVRDEFGDVTLPSARCCDCHHDTPHKAHHDPDGDCRDCDFSAGDCSSVRCVDQCEVGPCNCQARSVGETRFVIPRLAVEGASDAR